MKWIMCSFIFIFVAPQAKAMSLQQEKSALQKRIQGFQKWQDEEAQRDLERQKGIKSIRQKRIEWEKASEARRRNYRRKEHQVNPGEKAYLALQSKKEAEKLKLQESYSDKQNALNEFIKTNIIPLKKKEYQLEGDYAVRP